MLSHKLSNLLKLYRTASRVRNLSTINHCSQELDKVLTKIGGREVDPVARLYLNDLNVIHQECRHMLQSEIHKSAAA